MERNRSLFSGARKIASPNTQPKLLSAPDPVSGRCPVGGFKAIDFQRLTPLCDPPCNLIKDRIKQSLGVVINQTICPKSLSPE